MNLKQELITEDQKNVLVDGYLLWRVSDPIRYVEAIRTEANAVKRLSDLYRASVGIVVSNKSRDAFVSLGLQHQDITRRPAKSSIRSNPSRRRTTGSRSSGRVWSNTPCPRRTVPA